MASFLGSLAGGVESAAQTGIGQIQESRAAKIQRDRDVLLEQLKGVREMSLLKEQGSQAKQADVRKEKAAVAADTRKEIAAVAAETRRITGIGNAAQAEADAEEATAVRRLLTASGIDPEKVTEQALKQAKQIFATSKFKPKGVSPDVMAEQTAGLFSEVSSAFLALDPKTAKDLAKANGFKTPSDMFQAQVTSLAKLFKETIGTVEDQRIFGTNADPLWITQNTSMVYNDIIKNGGTPEYIRGEVQRHTREGNIDVANLYQAVLDTMIVSSTALESPGPTPPGPLGPVLERPKIGHHNLWRGEDPIQYNKNFLPLRFFNRLMNNARTQGSRGYKPEVEDNAIDSQ